MLTATAPNRATRHADWARTVAWSRTPPPTVAPVIQTITGEHHSRVADGAAKAWLAHIHQTDARAEARVLDLHKRDLMRSIGVMQEHYGPRFILAEIVKATGSRSLARVMVAGNVNGQLGLYRYTLGNRQGAFRHVNAVSASMHALSRCLQRTVSTTDADVAVGPLVDAMAVFIEHCLKAGKPDGEYRVMGGVFKLSKGEAVMATWLGDENFINK